MKNNFKFFYDPPVIIKKIFSSYQWVTRNNSILFTFDDGPDNETTGNILKILRLHKIKALFFCVGEKVSGNPGLVKEILDEGHTIGNHTYNHKKITGIKKDDVKNQIALFNNLMENKFDYHVNYFRPPYGRFNLSTKNILNEQGMLNIMWSLLTYDFKNDFNLVKFGVNKYLRNNSIVVLHDKTSCKEVTNDSIKYIVDTAAKNSFRIGKPEECLKQSF